MNILAPDNIGTLPLNMNPAAQTKIWAEEALFGHRLWARQTPWLLFLEFLNVAEANAAESLDDLFAPGEPAEPRYFDIRYRMGLRQILFSNEEMSRIAASGFDDEAQWAEWLKTMDDAHVQGGFGYLRQRFPRFRDFAELVDLVRQTTLETETNRRWSSRFIFPFGVDALYSDAAMKGGGPSPEYINFGRTGEILYLMLSRSDQASQLRERFGRLLDPDTPKNRLVARLAAPADRRRDRVQAGGSYLPYRQHPAFNRLGDDWLAILDLGLPEQDAFAHLVPLGALHIILYQLETAAAALGREGLPPLVCEMIAPRREFVRQRSIASFQANDALSRTALDAEVDRLVVSPAWQEILSAELSDDERSDLAADLLRDRFKYDERDNRGATPEEQVERLRQAIEAKHESACGLVHSSYGRYIGLASRRGTNRFRYAPTDSFLKTLVLTRVPVRLEFKKFLEDVFERYGLVFGDAEGRRALSEDAFDASAFERNRVRLEARLSSMGLLNRLSDGCAYVINPFASQKAEAA